MSLSICGRILTRSFLRKRRDVCYAEVDSSRLERTYTLFDLLCVGIGGTVGSGVFVLTGLIAREYTGPGVVISWLIAGFGCCFSAMSYAELSCRIPSAGSSYAYVYVALGEFPAVIAAWCLSLEYGISGSAVARSWGDKVNAYIRSIMISSYLKKSTEDRLFSSENNTVHNEVWNPFDPGYGINIFAGLLQIVVVLILLGGIDIGKFAVNTFTIIKMILVLFMIICGLLLFQPENLSEGWAPMGMGGILRGATSCFFGYVGYDEVCCLAAEAKDPNRVLPLAVFGTISIVTVFYCLASLALVGMQDYKQINTDSGFSEAFHLRGYPLAQNIVAIGEIVTLPLVVLVSFLAQPRLQYALSSDGLLPKIFTEIDRKGNFVKGILIAGFICTMIAVFVPFKYLDDMISAGVLISFNLTNSSLIVIRRSDPMNPNACNVTLISFNIVCILLHLILLHVNLSSSTIIIYVQLFIILSLFALLLFFTYYIYKHCPENEDIDSVHQFRVPYLPFVPLFGIFINYLLLAQLSYHGILLVSIYFGIASIFYFGYGIHHSKGNNTGWKPLVTPESSKIVLNKKYINLNSDEDMTHTNEAKGNMKKDSLFHSSNNNINYNNNYNNMKSDDRSNNCHNAAYVVLTAASVETVPHNINGTKSHPNINYINNINNNNSNDDCKESKIN